ncbi:MAG: hypothetical protein HYV09_07945 [Deltaproteobacteria bacterium]|nr:hypothetical protein [Deltaproteobacteria bacterium]
MAPRTTDAAHAAQRAEAIHHAPKKELRVMATKKIKSVPVQSELSQEVLDGTPMRALVFLRGSRGKSIRAILQRAGYTPEDRAEGWRLLKRSCGFFEDDDVLIQDEAAEAVKQLDAWDEGGFRRARAALARLHPEQCDFVFRGGLKPTQGLAAVMGVMTFLDRLDELEKSPERKSTRKADQAALATLAKRGIDDEERKRLRTLVKLIEATPELLDDGDETDDEKQAALVQLRAWFEDWSATARTVVTRRDHLIRLGLAKRKSGGKSEEVEEDEPAGDDSPTPRVAPTNGSARPEVTPAS